MHMLFESGNLLQLERNNIRWVSGEISMERNLNLGN